MDLKQFLGQLVKELPPRAANKQQRAIRRENRFRAYKLKERNEKRERLIQEERKRLLLAKELEADPE